MFETAMIAVGGLLVVTGLIGCVLPILPGPPLSFVGLLAQWWARGWNAEAYGMWTVVVLGVSALLVTVIDTIAPVWGAKRYGASKAGVWGSVLGMIGGAIFFPPFGMLLGAFVGALVGEMVFGHPESNAWAGAWGVFMGTVFGVVIKLVVSIAIAVYFVMELV